MWQVKEGGKATRLYVAVSQVLSCMETLLIIAFLFSNLNINLHILDSHLHSYCTSSVSNNLHIIITEKVIALWNHKCSGRRLLNTLVVFLSMDYLPIMDFTFLFVQALVWQWAGKGWSLGLHGPYPIISLLLRNYPPKFGLRLVGLWKRMATEKRGMPPLPNQLPSAEATFSSLTFDDLWTEARMDSVCHWLRGGTSLKIPASFYDLLPRKLWSLTTSL